MTDDAITQTVALPHGYKATFSWSPSAGMAVAWEPRPPDIRSLRAWRKFRDAYNAARRSFMTDVATTIGGAVLIANLGGATETIRPASRH